MKNHTCPPYWNSSKIKRVACLTIAAETLSLNGGCDVPIYINRLVSEILRGDGSQLDMITYTDNQSLYDAVHSMKQTLKKHLIL